MRPPFNLAAVEAATDSAVAAGHRLLQTHKYGETDADHVALLLDIMAPPEDAMVLDAGCGIGEVSRLMSEVRPDLSFVLMNISMHQLTQCPVGEQYLHALDDCHATLLNDASMDAVMFSSALCQMDIAVVLAEVRRVLKQGGILLVNDMVRVKGSADEMEQAIAARVLPTLALHDLIVDAGFQIDEWDEPQHDSTHFDAMLADAGLGHMVGDVKPVVIRAHACNVN